MKKYIIALCLLTQSLSYANPSLMEVLDLVTMPTAESLHYKEFNLSYDYLTNIDDTDKNSWKYSINLGTFENLEIGAVGGENPEEGVFLNGPF